MTITEIKKEVTELDDREQREILAHLVHIRQMKDPEYLDRITNLIDDKDPKNWASLDDFNREME